MTLFVGIIIGAVATVVAEFCLLLWLAHRAFKDIRL